MFLLHLVRKFLGTYLTGAYCTLHKLVSVEAEGFRFLIHYFTSLTVVSVDFSSETSEGRFIHNKIVKGLI